MNTISFPNMFDINSGKTSTNLSYNIKSINESLKSLLMTNPGELLGDPVYGCGIRRELFNIKTDINMNELRNIIIMAINKYLPQIIVTASGIKIFSNPNNNHYKIVINYMINESSNLNTFELII